MRKNRLSIFSVGTVNEVKTLPEMVIFPPLFFPCCHVGLTTGGRTTLSVVGDGQPCRQQVQRRPTGDSGEAMNRTREAAILPVPSDSLKLVILALSIAVWVRPELFSVAFHMSEQHVVIRVRSLTVIRVILAAKITVGPERRGVWETAGYHEQPGHLGQRSRHDEPQTQTACWREGKGVGRKEGGVEGD